MTRSLVEIFVVCRRILTEMARKRRSLIMWAIFPALMLLLFGLIYADGSSTSSSFDYTAPGILIGAALFFSCLGGPIALIVGEREHGTLRRLLLSPLRPSSYFLGICGALFAIAIGQTVIVYGIAYAFGGRFHGSLPLGFLIVMLSVISFVGLGFFFGARFGRRSEDVNGPVAAFGVPLLVLGGTFFPISILPPYLLKIGYLDPVLHMNEALKLVSAAGASAGDVMVHLIFLVAFSLVSIVLGVVSYRGMLRRELAA